MCPAIVRSTSVDGFAATAGHLCGPNGRLLAMAGRFPADDLAALPGVAGVLLDAAPRRASVLEGPGPPPVRVAPLSPLVTTQWLGDSLYADIETAAGGVW